jgi:hypothetical protein
LDPTDQKEFPESVPNREHVLELLTKNSTFKDLLEDMTKPFIYKNLIPQELSGQHPQYNTEHLQDLHATTGARI